MLAKVLCQRRISEAGPIFDNLKKECCQLLVVKRNIFLPLSKALVYVRVPLISPTCTCTSITGSECSVHDNMSHNFIVFYRKQKL